MSKKVFDINRKSIREGVTSKGDPQLFMDVIDRSTNKWGTFKVFGATKVAAFKEQLAADPRTRISADVFASVFDGGEYCAPRDQYVLTHTNTVKFYDRSNPGYTAKAAMHAAIEAKAEAGIQAKATRYEAELY